MSPRLVAQLSTIDRGVLGARIRVYRLGAQLRQAELVAAVGITAAYLSRIETGDRRPSVAVLERIAARLHVEVDQLLGDGDREGEEVAATLEVAVNAAARTVAAASSRWLGDPLDPLNYGELVDAVRRWERLAVAN